MQTSLKQMPKQVATQVHSITFLVNIALLLCHIYFNFLFYIYEADILFYCSCISTLIYIFEFWILKKNYATAYVFIVFGEIFTFMIICVICLGWDYGFQHYCIGFVASLIFTDFYISHGQHLRKRTIFLLAGNVILYLVLRFYTIYHPYIYKIDNPIIVNTLYISNTVLSFGFLIMYLLIYASTVSKLEKELLEMANKDPLTKLWNRRNMMEILKLSMDDNNTKINSIAMLDIDYFKKINDTYGHDAGDEALKKFAEILEEKKTSFSGFETSRWGGEEFLVLLKDYNGNSDSVVAEFEDIRKKVENTTIECNGKSFNITVTIGIAFYKDNLSIEELIKEADLNLYKGKGKGRNTVVY